jgi:hypothetical protein
VRCLGRGAPHECQELTCCDCREPYSVWYADDDLWNPVVRRFDGLDIAPFLCARCFLLRAQALLPCARITWPSNRNE